ncbi:MAG TPA: hypothetical protein VH142_00905 [Polyangiaceae bacterium]|jgi:hypothetical protein|nr:hypothetical protein [Polyangiaceae bacterium]
MKASSLLGAFPVVFALLGLPACSTPQSDPDVAAALAPFVLTALPDDAQPTFADFGGKLHLVGWSSSADGVAPPGSTINLKLYWKVVSPLEPGWGLFTHLIDDHGRRVRNFDDAGPFRKWLLTKPNEGLSLVEPDTLIVDEETLEMPKANELTPEVSLIVGAWKDDGQPQSPGFRLPVVSGTSDNHDAVILAHYKTGIVRPGLAMARQFHGRP